MEFDTKYLDFSLQKSPYILLRVCSDFFVQKNRHLLHLGSAFLLQILGLRFVGSARSFAHAPNLYRIFVSVCAYLYSAVFVRAIKLESHIC